VLLGWLALTAAGLVVAAALCLSGHAEDVARGFAEEPFSPYPGEAEPARDPGVTHR